VLKLPAQSLSRTGSAAAAPQEKHVGSVKWGKQPQSARAPNMEPLTSTKAKANPKTSFLFILVSLKVEFAIFFSFLIDSIMPCATLLGAT
jgi:hypothetical protein